LKNCSTKSIKKEQTLPKVSSHLEDFRNNGDFMRKVILLIVLTIALVSCNSSQEIYKNDTFAIYKDKVVQGEHTATVISDTEMKSNFRSSYKMPTKKVLDFKFALNGTDNERHPGEDHHLVLSPENGKQISPIYTFSEADPKEAQYDELLRNDYLENSVELTIQCNMRNVLKDFEELGYFILYNGEKFYAKDFKGVFVAGSTLPLSWNFSTLIDMPKFQLQDSDKDGIYEVTINISKFQTVDDTQFSSHWKLEQDLSYFPKFQCDIPLLNSLYNMSLEEMILDIRNDNSFMAGAKWPGVWTRDISYSIILSLAAIQPEVSMNSLIKKMDKDRIIQDTGTGGSWPVSSDRMIWAVAAWEVYKSSGDEVWLDKAYNVIKNSADTDLEIVYDKEFGLFRGESSFLDWREQTYPRWMEPKDIYKSMNLGTNALYYECFRILAEMAELLGEDGSKYQQVAETVKSSINKYLWQKEQGYYGQYLYGRNSMSISPKSEALGEALCIIFDIADESQKQSTLANMPVINYGPTCIFPQIPNIPPYHNDGIWPFVVAYWTLAAKDGGNFAAMEHGLGSIYRVASLYLSNYENMVAQTGDFMGTEINSERQLWSVAGDLTTIYKIFFGMKYMSDKLVFSPAIPENYGSNFSLKDFRYNQSTLDISINGFGDKVVEFKLDGKVQESTEIPNNLVGNHTIEITMNNDISNVGSINYVKNQYSPETPIVKHIDDNLVWEAAENARKYAILKDGKKIVETNTTEFSVKSDDFYAEYQVLAIDKNGLESFLSEPVIVTDSKLDLPMEDMVLDFTKSQLDKFTIEAEKIDDYYLLFDYSNGAGPINTSNKCAIRKLLINGEEVEPLILPQRGADNWEEIGTTLPIKVSLNKGQNHVNLIYDHDCENMNKFENKAIIRGMKIIQSK